MIFTEAHAQQMLDRSKWQTRRPVRPGEELAYVDGGKLSVIKVYPSGYWRVKWQVSRDYAVQVGRGKKAIGRTPLLEAIWRERLQEISRNDVLAEGIRVILTRPYSSIGTQAHFKRLWNSLYHKPYRWEDDIEVWALEFEKIE